MTLAAERADLPAPGCSAIRRPARKKAGKHTHPRPPKPFQTRDATFHAPYPTHPVKNIIFDLVMRNPGQVRDHQSTGPIATLRYCYRIFAPCVGGESKFNIRDRFDIEFAPCVGGRIPTGENAQVGRFFQSLPVLLLRLQVRGLDN